MVRDRRRAPPKPNDPSDTLYRVGTTGLPQSRSASQVVDGRLLDDRDGADAPLSVVVNETLARKYWRRRRALGHRMRFGDRDQSRSTRSSASSKTCESAATQLAMKPGVYVSFAQTP